MKNVAYVSLTYLMVFERDDDETEEDFRERVDAYVKGAEEEAQPYLGMPNDEEVEFCSQPWYE